MVDYELAPEQADLRATVAEFARDVVAPVIAGYYERAEFPYDFVAGMGKLGLFGLPFPEEYGGMGGDFFALCLAIEELARVDSSVAITLDAGVTPGAMPVYRFGRDEQPGRWLPDLCTGERIAAFGLTEPGGGTDIPGTMRTTARLDDGEWVINGTKAFITNAGTVITSLVTVLAMTSDSDVNKRENSTIIIPNGTVGFRPGPAYSKVGWCASDTRELSFADCRVPAASTRPRPAGGAGPGIRPVPAHAGRGPGGDRVTRDIHPPPAGHTGASTSALVTRASGSPLARRSAGIRRSRSSSPTWPSGSMPPGLPGTTPPPAWWRGRHSRRRRRWPSCSPQTRRWTTPATPPRSLAAPDS